MAFRSLLRPLLVGAAVAMFSTLLMVGTATAATDVGDGTYIAYTGTHHFVGGAGEVEPDQNIEFMGVRCKGDTCELFGVSVHDTRWSHVVDFSGGAGRMSVTLPQTGDLCNDVGGDLEFERHITLTATATSFTFIEDVPNTTTACPDSTSTSFGFVSTYTGLFVSGNPCVLDGAACPASSANDANPAPQGTSNSETPASGARTATRSELSTGGWNAASVLSGLPTIAATPVAPVQLGLAALVTIILVLLVAFPTALLNSAIEHGSERISAAWKRIRKPMPAPAGPPTVEASGWWKAALGVLMAGVISGFVDPQFGFNVGSARVLASILVSFTVEVVAGWWLLIWLVRRANPAVSARFEFKPISLIVVIIAVTFTRVTGFEPGIVFGLVAGVAFGAALATSGQAKATLASLGYGFGIALVAWVGYSLMADSSGRGADGPTQFFIDTLASLAIAGVAALPIALIPLRGLAGHAVFAWKRWVWATAYSISLLTFFFILLPMPSSWDQVSFSLWAWVIIYLTYAVVAVGLWLILARPWHRDPGPLAPATEAATRIEEFGHRH